MAPSTKKKKDAEAPAPAAGLIPGLEEPAPAAAPAGGGSGAPAAGATRAYTVLARRYRSRGFEEVVGQESIARTLQNAIATGRTAHAYLFCGTRGVGKTSMARIFARALNAQGQTQAAAIGDAILRGEDIDVIEIDGASNRGIDDARELIAGSGIAPARSPYKIYIIDEVHMLTTPAFNALLKTMEEPPAHVKFILCTTEPHKVPATIQSRCQRFDFRNITAPKIAAHLKAVLAKESIAAEDAAVMQVARLANGSMRDALSLLDRLVAASMDGRITAALLSEVLGIPDTALVGALVAAIGQGDPKAALERTGALLESGTSVEQALELLAERLRTLMLARVCGGESELLELADEARAEAARDAQAFDAAALAHMIAVCDAVLRAAKQSSSPRTLLDAAVVRLALAARFAPAEEVARGLAPPEPPAKKAPRPS
ncbi:MAG: DNA polymerase III subunit gamma/tau [Phycisphaerales bacterium]